MEKEKKKKSKDSLGRVLAIIAIVFSLPSLVLAMSGVFGFRLPGDIHREHTKEIALVKALVGTSAAATRNALAYVEPSSHAETYARVQIDLWLGAQWSPTPGDTWTVRQDGDDVVACVRRSGAPGCTTFSNFQFADDGNIDDFSENGVPIAALLLPPETTPRKTQSYLGITFSGARFSSASNSAKVALLVYNGSKDSIAIAGDGVYVGFDGRRVPMTVVAPKELTPGQRSIVYVGGAVDPGGWLAVKTTKKSSTTQDWSWVTVGP